MLVMFILLDLSNNRRLLKLWSFSLLCRKKILTVEIFKVSCEVILTHSLFVQHSQVFHALATDCVWISLSFWLSVRMYVVLYMISDLLWIIKECLITNCLSSWSILTVIGEIEKFCSGTSPNGKQSNLGYL